MLSSSKITKKKEKYVSERYYSITPSIKDNLWKSRQKHENHLEKLWHWKWDCLLEPDFEPKFRRESIDQKLLAEGKSLPLLKYKEYEQREYNLKKSPPFPLKSADVIGWRSTNKDNSFDMFVTKCTKPQKICFRDEQYGIYRAHKYIMQGCQEEQDKFVPPRRTIIHKINPLIC